MAKVPKRVRKPSEKAASSQATAAKTHKKSMKVKLNVEGRKPIPASKLVAPKQPPKSKAKDKAPAVSPIEVSSDSEEKENGEEEEDDEEKDDNEDDEDVERINAPLIAKKLFDQEDRRIIDSTKRVSDVKEDHVDVPSTQDSEEDEVIPPANKKDVDEILTLATKTYTLAWMAYFDNVQFDQDGGFSHTVINVRLH